MRRLIGIIAAAALVGCAAPRRREPLPWSNYADTIAVARRAGVHYLALTQRCLDGDERAMHALFLLTRDGGFDAASSQGHAEVLGMLLRHLGDDFFGRALSHEEDAVREAVLDDLRYDLGEGTTGSYLAYLYPITAGPPRGN